MAVKEFKLITVEDRINGTMFGVIVALDERGRLWRRPLYTADEDAKWEMLPRLGE